ncbi:transposable element Tcb2 transposase [Trichonephila clavipes]|uniref:Transposable element Tcb2 transposase n=1 Tax=Trichonephila clavipes TaxID=2585209 RepID=A0A8X6UYV0_TRICX|nr:transposable element Tcb2 transposase [Trichonephila clavipes]
MSSGNSLPQFNLVVQGGTERGFPHTLFCIYGRRRIWREPHEAVNSSFIIRPVQGSGVNIMIWGMFWHKSGALMFLEGKQTAMRYLDILADQVHPAMLHFYPVGDGYFIDDNATIHRPRSIHNWIPEDLFDLQYLPSPPHSPYLNPIENMWDIMKHTSDSTLLFPLIYKT